MSKIKLDERITLKEPIQSKEANGEITTTLQDLATVWSKVIVLAGTESTEGNKTVAKQKLRFVVRHRTDIKVTQVVEWLGDEYDILKAMPYKKTPRNTYTAIEAESRE